MYLNLSPGYFGHRKTRRLIGLMPKGSEVLPIRLWAYYAEAYPKGDGRLSDHSCQEIESLAGWWGTPGQMVEAMVKVGFLDKEADGTLVIHDWLDHQGHIRALKERSEKAHAVRWAEMREKAKRQAMQEVEPVAVLPPDLPSIPSLSERERVQGERAEQTRPFADRIKDAFPRKAAP